MSIQLRIVCKKPVVPAIKLFELGIQLIVFRIILILLSSTASLCGQKLFVLRSDFLVFGLKLLVQSHYFSVLLIVPLCLFHRGKVLALVILHILL